MTMIKYKLKLPFLEAVVQHKKISHLNSNPMSYHPDVQFLLILQKTNGIGMAIFLLL